MKIISDRCGFSASRQTFFAALALCLAAPLLGHSGVTSSPRPADPGAAFLVPLVERELEKAPIEGAALAAIYRRQVRSIEEAATFFYSAAFLRLHLGGQRQVIEAALQGDPASFLPQTEFLPVALREEYRRKAAAALEEEQLRRLARLSFEDQALLYLPSRQGMRATAAGREAFERSGQLRRFLKDPSLRHLAALENAWIAAAAGPFLSAEALVEAKVLTARNLFYRGLAPSPENVAAIWTGLAAARRELADLSLFGGRRVIFAAGDDSPGDGPTFGKTSTLAFLRNQEPASLELLRSGERGSTARLAQAIAAPGDLTLIFETHGRPDALQFGGALKAAELADMFAARGSAGRAIVIVNACFGHDFARAFAERLRARGAATPILIVPEEFGQATVIGRQENAFTRDELGLGRQNASRLGDLFSGRNRETAVYSTDGDFPAQLR